jgi:two-component system OmpR family sensor kinase
MKLSRLLMAALLTIPLWLGLVFDILLHAGGNLDTILNLQVRIDVGTLILIGGTGLSLALLVSWFTHQTASRRAQRSLAETQREAARMRRRFLGQLDHELKNPLTALRAEIAYLSEGSQVEDYSTALEDMSGQVERLGRLVSDLRKLAELEEVDLDKSPVDMADLLGEVMEAAQGHPGYEGRTVRLLLLQDPWPLPSIQGDRSLLWLACYNLLDNALKFTPPGAAIEVRAFEAAPWLIVELVDNGPGISEEDIPHLFEELYRGENARGYPGSGLGLALVKAIVSRHQGTIHVRSRPEQGTIFTMRLPITALDS